MKVGLLSITTAQRFCESHYTYAENRAMAELCYPGAELYEVYDGHNISHPEAKPTNWPNKLDIGDVQTLDALIVPAQPSPFTNEWSGKHHTAKALAELELFKGEVHYLLQDIRPQYCGWQNGWLCPKASTTKYFMPTSNPMLWLRTLAKIRRSYVAPELDKLLHERQVPFAFANGSPSEARAKFLRAYMPSNATVVGEPLGDWQCVGRKVGQDLAEYFCDVKASVLHRDKHLGRGWPTSRMAEAAAYGYALLIPEVYLAEYDWLPFIHAVLVYRGETPTFNHLLQAKTCWRSLLT